MTQISYTNDIIQNKLNLIKESVLKTVPDTETIYLFGSYVYGMPHKDSDIDICVVIPDSISDNPVDVSMKIRKNLYKTLRMPMDLFVKKSAVFNRRKQAATLEKVIAQDGVIIYGK